ncbi:MAG: FHA domain-containing protein [Coriobacteriales bacterium]|jgi:hypothetical protein|nr:FHA domain-containing protein [Coriobacteriales bacterium]
MKQCERGHFFDDVRYQECPYCDTVQPTYGSTVSTSEQLENTEAEPTEAAAPAAADADAGSPTEGAAPVTEVVLAPTIVTPAPTISAVTISPVSVSAVSTTAPPATTVTPAAPAAGAGADVAPAPAPAPAADATPAPATEAAGAPAPTTPAPPAVPAAAPDPAPAPSPDLATTATASAPQDIGATVGVFSASADTDPPVAFVIVIDGPDKGAAFALRAGRSFIGRGSGSDVELSGDAAVSREGHALISYDVRKNSFQVASGQSRYITYLNGEELVTPRSLAAYDTIEVGRSKLSFLPFCGERFRWEA